MSSGKWISVAGLAVVFAVVIAVLVTPPIKNHDLAVELMRMEARARPTFFSNSGGIQLGGIRRVSPDDEVAKARAANALRIVEIVATVGWPTKSMVGAEASHDAWLIAEGVQDVAFLETAYKSMAQHVDDVISQDFARLTDRVALAKGQPQIYGTLFGCVDNRLQPLTPIKDVAHLDARRRAAGLSAIPEDLRGIDTKFGGCGPSQGDAPATTLPSPPKP